MSKFVETCLGEGLRKPKVAGKNITVSSSEPHPGIYPDIYRLSDMLSRINTFSVLFSQYSHLDLPGTRFLSLVKHRQNCLLSSITCREIMRPKLP